MSGWLAEADVRLPAVDRTVDLLELLACSSQGLTLSEICRTTGIPKSSAHYLVYTLLTRGYLQRDLDGRTYSIGSRVPALIGVYDTERQLQAATRSRLREIAESTGLTAVATILNGAEALIIGKANPSRRESRGYWGNWIGRHIDAHCTAQGKILLAHLPEAELEGLLRDRPLARFTPKTIWSLADLKTHLAKIRSEGFALNDEEHVIGLRGIAAPVFSHVGQAVAAIGVTGSVEEMLRERIPKIAQQVISVAREVSRRFLESFPENI